MPDLTYRTDGLFTSFYPETEAGHAAWLQIFNQTDHTGKVMAWQTEDTIRQLRKAGYSVRRAPPIEMDDDALLSLLADPDRPEVYP